MVIGLLLPTEPAPAAYSTGRGEQTAVILPDSSQILLNHTSEVLISQTGGERRVSLKGEAFFRVRRTGEPFLVATEAGTVRVMGTEFNVRVRGDLLEVALLRGSVSVSSVGSNRDSSVVLSPGQTLSVPRGQAPGRPEGILHGKYPGWLHGKLFFQKASLTSVCREIESKFDVTVAIRTPRLAQETITGAVDARTAEAALGTIARLTGSSYKYEKNAYILY
jgi:transmembrane sensor